MPHATEPVRLPPRWHWRSLRARLVVSILLWIALGIGGVWFSATRLFEKHVELQYHEELEVHIKELAGLARETPSGRPYLDRPLSDPRYQVPLSGFYWQITVDGQPPLRSQSMTKGHLDMGVAQSAVVQHDLRAGPTGIAITYGFRQRLPDGRGVHFVIATDYRLLEDVIANFTRELVVWLGILALALIGMGALIVTFGFRPLDRLARAIARLRRGKADRLHGDYPTEISPLVDDLNAFIAHNARVVERGRIEAGNLAHALRTPLAVILDEAEQLAGQEETKASADVLLHHAQQMARQIQLRTVRARFAAVGGVPGSFSRLAEVLPPIVLAMRRLHPHIQFRMPDVIPDAAILPIDPVDLTELLSNLLDNAGKWAEAGVDVDIAWSDSWKVTVRDDGPGLTQDEISQVFGAGIRLDEEKPGTGLGLAISRDIAESYGFALSLTPQSPGLSATLRPADLLEDVQP